MSSGVFHIVIFHIVKRMNTDELIQQMDLISKECMAFFQFVSVFHPWKTWKDIQTPIVQKRKPASRREDDKNAL